MVQLVFLSLGILMLTCQTAILYLQNTCCTSVTTAILFYPAKCSCLKRALLILVKIGTSWLDHCKCTADAHASLEHLDILWNFTN